MTKPINLTRTRVAVLMLLAERNGYNVGGLAEAVAPRGAARAALSGVGLRERIERDRGRDDRA